ncbi:MAG: DUF4476 domain-containing protein [Niastella sp.]|nr:DUF4476 domain-containing protein [Niastella sp.]
MKRIAFVISLLTLSCTLVRAQQDYFIFISSENSQPFYIRLNEHTYSSSAIGHLVIPRLRDTTYTLEVGFPKKQYPERTFVVSLDKKDLDYQLKNTEKEGWVLFNAQTSEAVKPRLEQVKNSDLSLGERKTGAFATLMSALVNDSAVLYKSVVKVDVQPVKPAATAVKTDTQAVVIVEKEAAPARTVAVITPTPPVDSVQTEKNTIPVKIDTPIALSTVIPVQEWGNDKGKGYIYYDSTSVGMDTISLMIEFEKGAPLSLPTPEQVIAAPARIDTVKAVITPDTPATVAQKQPVPAAKDSTEKVTATIPQDIPANNTAEKTTAVTPPDTATKEATKQVVANTVPDSPAIAKEVVKAPPPVNAVDTAQKESIAKVKPDTPATTTAVKTDTPATAKTSYAPSKDDSAAAIEASKKPLLLMNSDCVNFASEYDVDKLRVKMLSANSVDDKVAAAKKVFKTKCFVTRYIRGLSELFPNDEARFKFFDAAYPFVSDTGNFRQLLDLFTDELYIARFKALVRM